MPSENSYMLLSHVYKNNISILLGRIIYILVDTAMHVLLFGKHGRN